MILTDGTEVRYSTGNGRYLSGMAEYLDLRCDLPDGTTGDMEAPTGHVALIGRYHVITDAQGFVTAERYPTRAEAAAAFDEVDAAYAAWLDA